MGRAELPCGAGCDWEWWQRQCAAAVVLSSLAESPLHGADSLAAVPNEVPWRRPVLAPASAAHKGVLGVGGIGGRSSAASQGRKKLKAYFINTDLDEARRRGAEETCRQLGLDCRRVVPPQLRSAEVQRCVETTPLRAFECSLVHAHRSILRQIRAAQDPAVVLEDDARLNGRVSPQHGQDLLARVNSRDFVMMGWCDPSCAHAYFVSPAGATMLLGRGFESCWEKDKPTAAGRLHVPSL
ncbi:unnamed protein product [Effrenium voratum]|uniref:Uncharacterized protein n=1 Tax=Effrenium voratum TaxID=2562239 RepID=A0AA36JTA0_9DINO|nr:unnamed protein product [Effrenium voratum]